MKERIITAIIAIPFVLLFVFNTSSVPIVLLASFVAFLSVKELHSLVFGDRRTLLPLLIAAGFGLTTYALTYAPMTTAWVWAISLVFFVAVGLLMGLLRRMSRDHLVASSYLWILSPLAGLVLLHRHAPTNHVWWPSPVLMALLPVWVADTAAIFFGKAMGRHRLAPAISPQKTWEGALGGMVASTIAGTLLAPALGLSLMVGVACGILAGILGPTGDLLESAIKRRCGAKDSGAFFPGHGGVLDRMDSVLMAAIPITIVILSAS